ncbi:tetratricopeptide repeat protein [Striga asiatica]|uniref:Tetratricopeptide repeat protein n=1 Tax=Striga asiatica TaxID=4170 RepID=A0A5A7R6C8_STRAF|nr:tetratricopeptide repeat protein [Striga asiatica]
MQTLIQKNFSFQFDPHIHSNFLSSRINHNEFLQIHQKERRFTLKSLKLLSAAASQSPSYGGWDDFQLGGDSVSSGESNQFYTLLSSIGIGDKKYAFVYLFGFVCALAISRVRVPTIMLFPASAIVFALGFAVGSVKGANFKELRSIENRKKLIEDEFRGLIEKLGDVRNNLKGYNAEFLSLKKGVERSIERNHITVTDLEGYVYSIESADKNLGKTIDLVEKCIKCALGGNEENGVVSELDPGRKGKKSGDSSLKKFDGFFGWKFGGGKAGKVESSGRVKSHDAEEVKNQKPENILVTPFENRNVNSAPSQGFENKSASTLNNPMDNDVRVRDRAENDSSFHGIGMEEMHFENKKTNLGELHGPGKKAVLDQKNYSHRKNTSKFLNNQQIHLKDYQDETEMVSSHYDSSSSVDFSVSMNRSQQKSETLNRNYLHLEITEENNQVYQRNFYTKENFVPEKRPSFANNQESTNDRIIGPSQSSVLGTDLEFNRYLSEANNLLKEAKGCLTQEVDESRAEHVLQKSALLLSKAIDMRPMSLLAVGQLGNTYLLHGELKLRSSRELRSLLVRSDHFLDGEWGKVLKKFEDQFNDRDEITSALVNVCEECEELLVKAGRKYKLALSIDGNDMRSMYNWGLALTFRAQLIADIGPSAARDADKIFLAAIDKFDAMMSKSNVYASDALFRWGAALQQRSQLRPSRSREKVKLLQQAKRLYEDALLMDSDNRSVREALSLCMSELDYWYK